MNQLIEFDEKTIARIESIKKRHASEVQLFISNWRTTKMNPRQKVSPTLRDMMIHEEMIAGVGRYSDAKYMHNRIASKVHKEGKEAQYKADRDYKMQLEALLKKQQQEMANFLDSRKYQRESIIRKQKDDLDVAYSKINVALNKPYSKSQKSDMKLPQQGLIRPIIHLNQSNQNLQKPKLLPSICPPPSKDEWVPPQKPAPVEVIKCVPKTRHRILQQQYSADTPIDRRKMQNALENLKRKFVSICQSNENKNDELMKTLKSLEVDDTLDPYTYLQNKNNPAHLKKKKKKKPENSLNLKWTAPLQTLSKPVKLNKDRIFRMVKEKGENKRQPPEIQSSRKPLRPPKKKKVSKEKDEEFTFNFDDGDEFKEKISLESTIKDTYDRIVDDKSSIIIEEPIKKEKKFKDIDRILQKYKKKNDTANDSIPPEEKIQLHLYHNPNDDNSSYSDEPQLSIENNSIKKHSIDRIEYSKVVNVIYDYSHINIQSEEEEEEFEEEEEEEEEFEDENSYLIQKNQNQRENSVVKIEVDPLNKAKILNLPQQNENIENKSNHIVHTIDDIKDSDNQPSLVNISENQENTECFVDSQDQSEIKSPNQNEEEQTSSNSSKEKHIFNSETDNLEPKPEIQYSENETPDNDNKEQSHINNKEIVVIDKNSTPVSQHQDEQSDYEESNSYDYYSDLIEDQNIIQGPHCSTLTNNHDQNRKNNTEITHHKVLKSNHHKKHKHSTIHHVNDKRISSSNRKKDIYYDEPADYQSQSSPSFPLLPLSSSGDNQHKSEKRNLVAKSKVDSKTSKQHRRTLKNPLVLSPLHSNQTDKKPPTSLNRSPSLNSHKISHSSLSTRHSSSTTSSNHQIKNDLRRDLNRSHGANSFRNSEEIPKTAKFLRKSTDVHFYLRNSQPHDFLDDELYSGSRIYTKTSGLIQLKH